MSVLAPSSHTRRISSDLDKKGEDISPSEPQRRVNWQAMGVEARIGAVMDGEPGNGDRAILIQTLVATNGHFLSRVPEDSPVWELLDEDLLRQVLVEGAEKQHLARRVIDYILGDRNQVVAVMASPQELAVDRVTKHLPRRDADAPVYRDALAALRAIPELPEETAEQERWLEHLHARGVPADTLDKS